MLLFLSLRLPNGQADANTGAAGKLRSLEEQLLRAKEQINSYRSIPVDGEKHAHYISHTLNTSLC